MSMPLRPGERTRLGRYELLGRLGEGGMGSVYLGRDETGRQVAIKVIRAEYAHDAEFRGRFRSEVSRAKQVPPFSTAEVLDADPDHDPPYLVVEYVDGPSLATVIREHGPLAGSALHAVAVGTATALTAIHGAGVIHRDLKPGNVLLAMGGVKVIDFGIARPFEATSNHTGTDQMVGTVAYMAPERFDPVHGRKVTSAADVFSWGAVVQYAATGRTPFAADSAPATAMRILTQPPDLSGLPDFLHDIVERSLAKDPQDRPTARDLLDVLLAGHTPRAAAMPAPVPPDQRVPAPRGMASVPAPLAATHHPLPQSPVPEKRRSGLRTAAVAAAVFVVLLGGALVGMHLLSRATSDNSAGADIAGTSAPAGDGPSKTGPSSAHPQPSPVDVNAAILRGNRRTLIHLAEFNRDLALDRHDYEVEGGDGTGVRSQFVLVNMGVDYLIKSLRSGDNTEDGETCLGVKVIPDKNSTLVAADCSASKATLFALPPTGDKDDKGRPTYRIYNESYGFVQWDQQRKVVYVQEVGDAEPIGSFSFVDRGAI